MYNMPWNYVFIVLFLQTYFTIFYIMNVFDKPVLYILNFLYMLQRVGAG